MQKSHPHETVLKKENFHRRWCFSDILRYSKYFRSLLESKSRYCFASKSRLISKLSTQMQLIFCANKSDSCFFYFTFFPGIFFFFFHRGVQQWFFFQRGWKWKSGFSRFGDGWRVALLTMMRWYADDYACSDDGMAIFGKKCRPFFRWWWWCSKFWKTNKKSSSYKFCRIATVYTVYTELFWIQFDGISVPVHLFL